MNEETRIASDAVDLMDSLLHQFQNAVWDRAEEIAKVRAEPARILESDVEQAFKSLTSP